MTPPAGPTSKQGPAFAYATREGLHACRALSGWLPYPYLHSNLTMLYCISKNHLPAEDRPCAPWHHDAISVVRTCQEATARSCRQEATARKLPPGSCCREAAARKLLPGSCCREAAAGKLLPGASHQPVGGAYLAPPARGSGPWQCYLAPPARGSDPWQCYLAPPARGSDPWACNLTVCGS